jgi:hypothetical protein
MEEDDYVLIINDGEEFRIYRAANMLVVRWVNYTQPGINNGKDVVNIFADEATFLKSSCCWCISDQVVRKLKEAGFYPW